jgi:hypothetical protein
VKGVWLEFLPSAGGKLPVWQLAHWALTGIWVWSQRLGFQPVGEWQVPQLALPTGMWALPLPLAPPLPLWQLAQSVAALYLLWSTLVPDQLLVERWQSSQTVCAACTVLFGFRPVWQVAHWAVTVTALCSLAGVQARKPLLWQLSQAVPAIAPTCVKGVWLGPMPVALLPLWQVAQVPAAMPL